MKKEELGQDFQQQVSVLSIKEGDLISIVIKYDDMYPEVMKHLTDSYRKTIESLGFKNVKVVCISVGHEDSVDFTVIRQEDQK